MTSENVQRMYLVLKTILLYRNASGISILRRLGHGASLKPLNRHRKDTDARPKITQEKFYSLPGIPFLSLRLSCLSGWFQSIFRVPDDKKNNPKRRIKSCWDRPHSSKMFGQLVETSIGEPTFEKYFLSGQQNLSIGDMKQSQLELLKSQIFKKRFYTGSCQCSEPELILVPDAKKTNPQRRIKSCWDRPHSSKMFGQLVDTSIGEPKFEKYCLSGQHNLSIGDMKQSQLELLKSQIFIISSIHEINSLGKRWRLVHTVFLWLGDNESVDKGENVRNYSSLSAPSLGLEPAPNLLNIFRKTCFCSYYSLFEI
ncbi:hypothetical protein ROZALSC1DRAFT_21313 [Rozella allomycis CSF55]|uniref:Uncharacterized protein n=1 Tax=Rozella allomycis (strain CSF55) TaxID=988480 RepID=A0A4P9YLK2_ROZAC|nr:hypothetical protein ROZALSC1DRAFT_21313 [Rozella allomycis CSF55]